jgi:hypothetical protein
LQYEFTNFFSFHFQREEEVEHTGQEEDLEVVGLEETSDGGQDSMEDEEEEGTRRVCGCSTRAWG